MKKTLALLLAVMMVLCLFAACGEKTEEAPAEEPVAEEPVAEEPVAEEPAAEEPVVEDAAPAEDAASGEPSGEASTGEPQSFELFDASSYDKTFDGYKQYCIDAINSTDGPADILANDVATVEAMTEDTYDDTALSMYVEFGLITDYATFVG